MRAYGVDLRERILRGIKDGERAAELAKRYRVAVRTVYKYWERYRDHGETQGRQHGGYRRPLLEKHDATLRQWIQAQNDITLAELAQRLLEEKKIRVGVSTLWRRLNALKLSLKKKHPRRRATSLRR